MANHHGRALRHVIVAMDGTVSCRDRLDAGLDVRLLEAQVVKGDWLGTWRRLRQVLDDVRPDVLLTHNWGSIDWALANALPSGRRSRHVHVEDGFGPEERDRQIGRRVWTRRLALRRSTVALPSLMLMQMAGAVWRLNRQRLRYIPNGVDLARFTPRTAPSGGKVVVGTVAALRPEKNLARLLRAVAMMPDIDLVIIGDGPERAALVGLAGQLGIAERVEFAGQITDPAEMYRRMDIFALSSDTEQMPLSVLEAMAAGLPVAATAVGDVASMVSAENESFVVAREVPALAIAIAQLAADAARRRRVGDANRAKAVQAYDTAGMFAAWGELLTAGE